MYLCSKRQRFYKNEVNSPIIMIRLKKKTKPIYIHLEWKYRERTCVASVSDFIKMRLIHQ